MGLKIDRRAQTITKILGVAILLVLIFIILKLFFWEQNYYRTKSAETRNTEQAVITGIASANSPIEQEISEEEYNKHQVNASAPRYLEIERLGVKARVLESEVDEHTLPVPDDIYDISWYSGSSRPGGNGVILMSGISAGQTKPGVFANLDSLEKKDEIVIVRGDGVRFTYKVAETTIIDKTEAAKALPEAQKRIDGKETLTLVSARRSNENDSEFNSIVIVRATYDKQSEK